MICGYVSCARKTVAACHLVRRGNSLKLLILFLNDVITVLNADYEM